MTAQRGKQVSWSEGLFNLPPPICERGTFVYTKYVPWRCKVGKGWPSKSPTRWLGVLHLHVFNERRKTADWHECQETTYICDAPSPSLQIHRQHHSIKLHVRHNEGKKTRKRGKFFVTPLTKSTKNVWQFLAFTGHCHVFYLDWFLLFL